MVALTDHSKRCGGPVRIVGERGRSLLLKPLPIVSESLLSLISRAAAENVFPRTADVLALARVKTLRPGYVPFAHTDAAESIAAVLGIQTKEAVHRMHPRVANESGSDIIDWYGTP